MSDAGLDPEPEGIAIIGMSGRFPGAETVTEFWENIKAGIEAITCLTDEELLAAGVSASLLKNPNYVKAASFLSDIEHFDAPFFALSPRDATLMDPQQRLFLECAWEALEVAGYDPHRYPGSIGVFAGAGLNLYLLSNLMANRECWATDGQYQILLNNGTDHLATRVSYKLNLRGPSVTIQTSCSTSLVAVHLACQSLLNYECDMSLAGGVSLKLPQRAGYMYQEGGILSPDGHCRAFDSEAKGTVGGSGAGIVVLKRLADALAEGDNVLAVIKGTAINNDGAGKVGYTAPSVQGQAEAIVAAAGIAGVSLDSIDYVETHGTGTPLGDPIEIAALTQAFRTQTRRNTFCALGSVKTNVGHLNTAAGVVGLMKTVLALRDCQLPPSLHFRQPNPQIDFANSPFYVNTALAPWKAKSGPRTAGVSSFGIGGTNAHVIVEEAPVAAAASPGYPWLLLPLSARTPEALQTVATGLASHLRETPDLNPGDVAYTLQVGRHPFAQRRVLLCRNLEEAVEELENPVVEAANRAADVPQKRDVLFLLPGQGARLLNEGREIYLHVPLFREMVDHCAAQLQKHLGLDIRDLLYPKPDCQDWAQEQLKQTALVQPILFVLEYALAQLWRAWGVNPQALAGHSLGEYTAACLSGVFSLESALWLVAERGKLQQQTPPGAMVAVSLSEEEAQPWLSNQLWLAAVNGPGQCTLSGYPEAVERLEAGLRERGVMFTRLATSHAFHSGLMDGIIEPFIERMRRVVLSPPQIPYISNVTGTWIQPHEATDAAYWGRHLREPVRFGQGVEQACRDLDQATLLEVGPGKILTRLSRGTARSFGGAAISSLPGRSAPTVQEDGAELQAVEEVSPEFKGLMEAAGSLWLTGVEIDWKHFTGEQRRRRIPLPTYPFQRKRHWMDLPPKSSRAQAHVPSTQADRREDMSDWFYLPAWKRSQLLSAYAPDSTEDRSGAWLLFADSTGLGSQLARRLEQDGQRVVVVSPGAEFRWTGENQVAINTQSSDDYARLIAESAERHGAPRRILHLWNVAACSSPVDPHDHFARAQEQGFYSLLYLAQALTRSGNNNASLLVVGNGLCDVSGEEDLCPDKAPLVGLCTVLRQEYADLQSHCIDILSSRKVTQNDWLADQLLAEAVQASAEPLVAYRGKSRLLLDYQPAPLDDRKRPLRTLRTEGVYLITGGLGRIGLALAEHLANSLRARLILVGRSGFPAREQWDAWLAAHGEADPTSARIRALLALEQAGNSVSIVMADVADVQEMRRVIANIYARFGALHGVFHVAGIPREEGAFTPLGEMTAITAERHFRAKAHGLYALEQALEGRDIDFCALFGSNASLLGGFGYGAYAAANCFMNAFAADRTRRSPVPWLSINWDGWLMSKTQEQARTSERIYRFSVTPSEGFAALERIVCHYSSGPVVVSTTDLVGRIRTWLYNEVALPVPATEQHGQEIGEESATQAEPPSTYIAPRNAVEQAIVEIWQRLLGIERVGVEDNFFDLNGHSLLAVQLMAQIERNFGRKIPLRVLFQSATVAGLARELNDLPETAGQANANSFSSVLTNLASVPENAVPSTQRDLSSVSDASSWVNIITPERPSSTGCPLFCVAAPEINSLGYISLGHNLGDKQPLFVLQSHFRSAIDRPYTKEELQELAAMYIQAMRTVRPSGPYCLGGMCEGTHIAFCMARQLQAEGEEVSLLFSFDTWPEENTRTRFGWWRFHILKVLAKKSTGLGSKINEVLKVTARSLYNWVIRAIRPPDPTKWDAHYWPGRGFSPDRFQGSMVVFRVEKQRIYRIKRRDLGWGDWITDDVEIFEVSGEHSSLLREPNVIKVATILNKYLNENSKQEPFGQALSDAVEDRTCDIADTQSAFHKLQK